jgi:hypothetical protein
MRSIGPFGRPFVSFLHVAPPSTDLKKAVAPPPLSKRHGLRRNEYMPAYTMRGFDGSSSTSEHPVS